MKTRRISPIATTQKHSVIKDQRYWSLHREPVWNQIQGRIITEQDRSIDIDQQNERRIVQQMRTRQRKLERVSVQLSSKQKVDRLNYDSLKEDYDMSSIDPKIFRKYKPKLNFWYADNSWNRLDEKSSKHLNILFHYQRGQQEKQPDNLRQRDESFRKSREPIRLRTLDSDANQGRTQVNSAFSTRVKKGILKNFLTENTEDEEQAPITKTQKLTVRIQEPPIRIRAKSNQENILNSEISQLDIFDQKQLSLKRPRTFSRLDYKR